jgi:hypothetical protein
MFVSSHIFSINGYINGRTNNTTDPEITVNTKMGEITRPYRYNLAEIALGNGTLRNGSSSTGERIE